MATLTGQLRYSLADTMRSIQTAQRKHLKQVEDVNLRSYKILAKIDQMGLMRFNSPGIEWNFRTSLANVRTNDGQRTLQIEESHPYAKAYLKSGGYYASDGMSHAEWLEQKDSQTRVIDHFGKMADYLGEAIMQKLAGQFYVNRNATGNSAGWDGLDTVFGTVTNSVNYTTGAEQSASAADYVAWPDATYAGQSTELGAQGGSAPASDIWPNGIADPEYDCWSPLIVFTDSTRWSAGASWALSCEEAISWAIVHASRNDTKKDQIDTILCNRVDYNDFKNKLRAKERIIVEKSTGLRSLGFTDVFEFDGLEVTYENAIASNVNYGIAFGNVELFSAYPTLIDSVGPKEGDEREQAYFAFARVMGNLKFASPRNFIKFMRQADV